MFPFIDFRHSSGGNEFVNNSNGNNVKMDQVGLLFIALVFAVEKCLSFLKKQMIVLLFKNVSF